MTSAARQAEADRVELVYYWALNQLGNAVAVDALALWEDVPATQQAATSASWLARVLHLMFGIRKEASDLAVAYYRLVRALRTGYAPAIGDEQDGDTTTLEDLRQDFEKIVDHIEVETQGDVAPNWGEDADVAYDDEPAYEPGDEDAEIVLEHVADIDGYIETLDTEAEQEAAERIDHNGVANLLRKLEQIKADAEDREQQIAQAHQEAGSRQASTAMRITMNAARGLVYDLSATDKRVIGWARYSRSGSPCGWCAMLISRGVIYKTRKAAQHRGQDQEEDKYHDNCRCVAVPIFVEAQKQSDLFNLNNEYDRLWKKYIKGKHGGKRALTVWRHYVRYGFPNGDGVRAAPEAA